MAFEVADFEAFFAILGQHPEWQVRLRRMLLDEATADSRREMNEGFARLTESGARLDERLSQLTATVDRFSEETRARLDRLERDMAVVKGETKENWYRTRATGVFGMHLDAVRVVGMGDLPGLRQAQRAGRISREEWQDAQRLDLMISGRDDDGRDILVAVEVSFNLDADDVSRAVRRAGVLRKAGFLVQAAVAGPEVGAHVAALAAESGVAVLRDGVPLTWPGAT